MYDMIIVGGGPAGLTAAVYALRAGKTVLVIEKNSFGGQIAFSPKVENIPGTQVISGSEFAEKLIEQAMALGDEAWAENPGEDWSFQAAVIELGMLMRDSEYAGTSSLDEVRTLAGADRDGFLDVVESL